MASSVSVASALLLATTFTPCMVRPYSRPLALAAVRSIVPSGGESIPPFHAPRLPPPPAAPPLRTRYCWMFILAQNEQLAHERLRPLDRPFDETPACASDSSQRTYPTRRCFRSRRKSSARLHRRWCAFLPPAIATSPLTAAMRKTGRQQAACPEGSERVPERLVRPLLANTHTSQFAFGGEGCGGLWHVCVL